MKVFCRKCCSYVLPATETQTADEALAQHISVCHSDETPAVVDHYSLRVEEREMYGVPAPGEH